MMGQCRRSEGDLGSALMHFQRAVDRAASDPWHQSDLAKTCFQAWRKEPDDRSLLLRAIEAFERAVKLQPQNNDWLFNLILVLHEAGDSKKAQPYARTYLDRDSSSRDAEWIIKNVVQDRP
jgi:tetratricopeptide (TPR) repeat protein